MKILLALAVGAAAGVAGCLAVLSMPQTPAGAELAADEDAVYTDLFGEGSR